MADSKRHLDLGSRAVIVITFALFIAAIFFKGLGHDLLLEAGVFLVSVKLIMMAYKNSIVAATLNERLDTLQATLTRLTTSIEAARQAELPRPVSRPTESPAASRGA